MKNLILLTIDILRRDKLGIYGDKKRLTSSIDTLTSSSIIFNRVQANGPYNR